MRTHDDYRSEPHPENTEGQHTLVPNYFRSMLDTVISNRLATAIIAVLVVGGVVGFAIWPSASNTSALERSSQEVEAAQHAGEGHGVEEVHLDDGQVEQLGIRTAKLEAGSATSMLERPATIMFNRDRVARVGPRASAKVVRVLKDLGDTVRRGEPLAIMSSFSLGRAKSAYLTSEAHLKSARSTYEREQKLFDKQISSEAELLEAEARYREALAETKGAAETLRLYGLSAQQIKNLSFDGESPASQFYLTSPISGTVQERELSPGETVSVNETPIQIANTHQLWVMIDAFGRDAPLLEEGQPIRLTVSGLPDKTFQGQIDWISYALNDETRTVRVRAIVDNENGDLRAGMFGTAHIATDATVSYPLVPADAVQTIGDRQVVFVPGEESGAFHPVTVKTGSESENGRVEITAGLKPGDEAVVAGAFDLKSALTSGSRSATHSH